MVWAAPLLGSLPRTGALLGVYARKERPSDMDVVQVLGETLSGLSSASPRPGLELVRGSK